MSALQPFHPLRAPLVLWRWFHLQVQIVVQASVWLLQALPVAWVIRSSALQDQRKSRCQNQNPTCAQDLAAWDSRKTVSWALGKVLLRLMFAGAEASGPVVGMKASLLLAQLRCRSSPSLLQDALCQDGPAARQSHVRSFSHRPLPKAAESGYHRRCRRSCQDWGVVVSSAHLLHRYPLFLFPPPSAYISPTA